uniref:Uncharacterized protein LOC104229798 n=1 Tax=Nicotiana sylvestris TaxID=4096 RepID=A0A1U7WU19_NICSY|nr:PREDICTED: uncharacterized protein LOC104229798 [Nicotiana sylvestris]
MARNTARGVVAYLTTLKSSAGETPFSLVYGAEALIPVEVGEQSTKFRHASEESNHKAMSTALELLDERREATLVRMAAQKQKIKRYYNKRTNLRYFGIRELVLRKVTLNTRNPNEEKLGQNWEGSYHVLGIVSKGSYKLGIMEGEQLLSNWNVSMLKRYYCSQPRHSEILNSTRRSEASAEPAELSFLDWVSNLKGPAKKDI